MNLQAYQIQRRVKDIPLQERPREIFSRDGAESVNDRVLLAIILRSGVRGRSVVDLADKLLQDYGSLTALARVSVEELAGVHGMGPVKAQVLKSALELGRRLTSEFTPHQPTVRTSTDVFNILKHEARVREEELFWVLLLDTKYRLQRPPLQISQGILDASLVHPREVFKEAIRSCSAAIVLAHNHPSGDPYPSPEDLRITRQLIEAGKVVDIQVLDHVILGRPTSESDCGFSSLKELELVKFD